MATLRENQGAILLGDASLTISNCSFINNTASTGGAIAMTGEGMTGGLVVDYSLFEGNSATLHGRNGTGGALAVGSHNITGPNPSAITLNDPPPAREGFTCTPHHCVRL